MNILQPTFARLSFRESACLLHQSRYKMKRSRFGKPQNLAESFTEHVRKIEGQGKLGDARPNIGYTEVKLKLVDNVAFRKLREQKDLAMLERRARKRELNIPVDKCEQESFKTDRQQSITSVAEHYGLYRDLYRNAYFYPQIPLDILYEVEDEPEQVNPVFYGNIIPPSERIMENQINIMKKSWKYHGILLKKVRTTPQVVYPGEEDSLYTLCMTALDSHLQDKNKEYLHWLIGNIPGSAVNEGDLLCDYLVPFPVHGTGLHRYVFVLYKQDRRIDFSKECRSSNCSSLRERTFETFNFLKTHQNDITPVGLSFFQSEYDESVRNTFHNILGMDEPRYDFYPPLKYIPKQKLWPIREPFNLYLDRYRDVRDINEEVLMEKLKNAEPFKPRPLPKKYPNIYRIGNDVPSWLKEKIIDKRLRRSYWRNLDD